MKKCYVCFLAALLLFTGIAHAAADLKGEVTNISIRGGNNNLHPNADVDIIRKSGGKTLQDHRLNRWGGRFVVPVDHPSFSYWYGMRPLRDAAEHGVKVANISYFDGTTSCEISKTGYRPILKRE